MSTNRVEVDPEALWSAARTISATGDVANTQLQSSDTAMAGCRAGWATRASHGFDEFMDRSERFTRDLSLKLADIEQATRAAAAHYERSDSKSGRRIAESTGSPRLLDL
ncbi:WXG100 family type VII secretion target [Gordonia sp. HS-NH1]|uniref:WXG100 family type VII secretion target n=1 Tax=Gordonia sp. HS-NH1 TaxID=1435068 RepID=UPI0006E34EAA|nr:WXG100 family type VII secretion target [Gordonia sp. HS-NH1]